MLKIKTSELTGPALDYVIAKALGYTDYPEDSIEYGTIWHTEPDKTPFGRFIEKLYFSPSTNWAQGGQIIERERITISQGRDLMASIWINAYGENGGYKFKQTGLTPLIAAMRAYVASRLGDEVEIPANILEY